MMKDEIINSWSKELASIVLPIFIKRDKVPELLDSNNKSESQFRWATVQLIIALCLLLTAALFLVSIIVFIVFRLLDFVLLAEVIQSFLVSVPLSLALLMSVKLQAIQNFYKNNTKETPLPDRYLYKACDIDLWFSVLVTILITTLFVVVF